MSVFGMCKVARHVEVQLHLPDCVQMLDTVAQALKNNEHFHKVYKLCVLYA